MNWRLSQPSCQLQEQMTRQTSENPIILAAKFQTYRFSLKILRIDMRSSVRALPSSTKQILI